MVKSLAIAFVVHIMLFTLVWVGFAIPLPRDGVMFFYAGSYLPAENMAQQAGAVTNPVAIKADSERYFTPWVRMRAVNKPKH